MGKLTGDHLFLMQIESHWREVHASPLFRQRRHPALLSGEVDAYFGSGSSFLRMEKTRGLAIGSKERYELCPDVPTFIEQGYAIESGKYRGLATPPEHSCRSGSIWKPSSRNSAPTLNTRRRSRRRLMPQFQTGKAFGEIIRTEGEQAKNPGGLHGLLVGFRGGETLSAIDASPMKRAR